MNKVITIEFDSEVTITKIAEEGLTFSDGTTIEHYHNQDCCEWVYAEWKALEDTGIDKEKFKKLDIFGNPELGISLNGAYGVPCYNSQNGYYSDELSLKINQTGRPEVEVDISNFVKDDIY